MCGITGVMTFGGRPIDMGTLERMTATLAHRGPDAQGVVRLATGPVEVALGHTRLRIIDLSPAAEQPMQNADASISVTFNGEIYNYRELRAELVAQGVRFRSASDTEVIVHLYEREGEACLDRLDGMFALAIWDARRRRLVLARDRVGKKPLYYAERPNFFAFASEIKALLRHPAVDTEMNVSAVPAFFLYGYVPNPATMYRGIVQVPPGHVLVVEADGSTTVKEYWDLPLPRVGTRRPPSEAEAAATVRELVTKAVERRLVSDVPLGAFLSGGIDSSIVVGVMSRLMKEPVRTFSIGFANAPAFDETSYARAAAERFETLHEEFVVAPSAIDLVERLVWHHDGPFADSSAIPTYLLSRLTRAHVTVALNGDGGDEVFAGYLRFYAAVASERVPRVLREAAGAMLSVVPEWGGRRSPLRRARRFGGSVALPFVERYTRWISVFYEDLARLLPGLVDRRFVPSPLSHQARYVERAAGSSPLTQLLYLNMKTYLADDLQVKMDRCAMAHGLEARSPFLDRALMEYVATLPDDLKLRRGQTKYILKRAFSDLLPEAIRRRGKMGFGVPLGAWFRGELRDYVGDLVLAPDARLRDVIDQSYVRSLVYEHLSGRRDHSHRLWTILTFEIWLRQWRQWQTAPAERAV
jgi:asparagine synthase (glutamine-hydrolysing)